LKIIGSTAEAQIILNKLLAANPDLNSDEFIAAIENAILKKKIRYPVIEYLTKKLFTLIPFREQKKFLDKIIAQKKVGSYVIAGKMLQLRLEKDLKGSLKKAEEYIIEGNEWYVCDIIGERVFGHGLLTYPEKLIPILRKYADHDDKWMVRVIGVAGHYAIKKGLDKKSVEEMFKLLLSLANVTDFHTKKGIGWAAKTTSKFYPDLVKKYEKEINNPEVRQWFRTKIKIGLELRLNTRGGTIEQRLFLTTKHARRRRGRKVIYFALHQKPLT
jgi:3-methyladenine DNA glycosylase AlkD